MRQFVLISHCPFGPAFFVTLPSLHSFMISLYCLFILSLFPICPVWSFYVTFSFVPHSADLSWPSLLYHHLVLFCTFFITFYSLVSTSPFFMLNPTIHSSIHLFNWELSAFMTGTVVGRDVISSCVLTPGHVSDSVFFFFNVGIHC